MEIDLPSRQVTVRGRTSRLTAKEFDLLSYFLARPNKTIAHRELLQASGARIMATNWNI